MQIETELDPNRADNLVGSLRRVAHLAEPALEEEELQAVEEAAEFIEEAACIRTGEQLMQSPMTETTYRVTRWIDAGDGNVIALSKEEVEAPETEEA